MAVVLRIPNVPAGAASYVFTSSSATGVGLMFDYWQWEAPATEGPLVVLVKQPHPLDYTGYGAVAPGPPTDAGVDLTNASFDTLAAEFGSRVITVTTSGINADVSCWSAGNVHPNTKGHRYIATQIVAAIKAAATITASPTLYAPRTEYGTAIPTGLDRNYFVGDRMVNLAPAELGSAASKYVIDGWVCTAAGAPGTWLAQRTLTGN
jgi:hypothetical protein